MDRGRMWGGGVPGSQNLVPPTSQPPSYLHECLQETLSIHPPAGALPPTGDVTPASYEDRAFASQPVLTSNLQKDLFTLLPANIQGGAETPGDT